MRCCLAQRPRTLGFDVVCSVRCCGRDRIGASRDQTVRLIGAQAFVSCRCPYQPQRLLHIGLTLFFFQKPGRSENHAAPLRVCHIMYVLAYGAHIGSDRDGVKFVVQHNPRGFGKATNTCRARLETKLRPDGEAPKNFENQETQNPRPRGTPSLLRDTNSCVNQGLKDCQPGMMARHELIGSFHLSIK